MLGPAQIPLESHGSPMVGPRRARQPRARVVRSLACVLCGAAIAVRAAAQVASGTVDLDIRVRWSADGRSLQLRSVGGMVEGPNGTVWVSDPRRGRIVALDAAGRLDHVVADSAVAGAEVSVPERMVRTDEGGVAVHDVGVSAVLLYDALGRFVRSVGLSASLMNPKGFAVTPSGAFLLTGGIDANGFSVHRFGRDGRLQVSWVPVPATRSIRAGLMTAGGPVFVTPPGEVLFSQAAPHQITLFSDSARELGVVASDPRLVPAIGDAIIVDTVIDGEWTRFIRWLYPQSRGVFMRLDGTILNVVVLPEERRSIWQLYARDGRLLRQRAIGRAYVPWTQTSTGDILASYWGPDSDRPVAVRLEIATLSLTGCQRRSGLHTFADEDCTLRAACPRVA